MLTVVVVVVGVPTVGAKILKQFLFIGRRSFDRSLRCYSQEGGARPGRGIILFKEVYIQTSALAIESIFIEPFGMIGKLVQISWLVNSNEFTNHPHCCGRSKNIEIHIQIKAMEVESIYYDIRWWWWWPLFKIINSQRSRSHAPLLLIISIFRRSFAGQTHPHPTISCCTLISGMMSRWCVVYRFQYCLGARERGRSLDAWDREDVSSAQLSGNINYNGNRERTIPDRITSAPRQFMRWTWPRKQE